MIISPMKVTLIDSMGSDLSIVNAARVSFHKESTLEDGQCMFVANGGCVCDTAGCCPDKRGKTVGGLREQDQRLIRYLAKHGHFTPFCHAFLSFRIKAPIFVARQLVKHQVGLAWNEVSRRYVDDEPEFWFPEVWRGRAKNVKQGSSNEALTFKDCYGQASKHPCIDLPTGCADAVGLTELVLEMYNTMLAAGVAPEQARMVLPQNTMTEWIWSGSLAAFARVCKLRLDPHAQKETQEIAQQINDAVPTSFEHSWTALLA